MSTQRGIYDVRKIIDSSRQRAYQDKLAELDTELLSRGENHPYALRDPHHFRKTFTWFRERGEGPMANPGDTLLYSLNSMRKVMKCTDWKWRTPYEIHAKDQELFDRLEQEYQQAGVPWLQLRDFASGSFSGWCGITWWTATDKICNNVVCGAHIAGIPNDRIYEHSLLLRCSNEYIRKNHLAHIPTILDGCDSEIFHSTDHRHMTPSSGVAINLENHNFHNSCTYEGLKLGVDEYVLRSIPVAEIQVRPIYISDAMKDNHVVTMGAQLRDQLVKYYEDLK